MGAYANCWLGGVLAAASKNVVDPNVLSLYSPADRIVRRSDDAGLPECIADDLDDADEGPFDVVYYQKSTRVARDQLELMGYTSETARRLYQESMAFMANARQPLKGRDDAYPRSVQLTADQWMWYQKYCGAPDYTRLQMETSPHRLDSELLRALENHTTFIDECPDPLVGVRLAIDTCPEIDMIVYNLTNLILCEELSEDEDPFDLLTDTEALAHGRTIILTEGRTDAWILKESFSLLYPHLAASFSFMDFVEFRAVGGAGPLANLVKSFAAAGILNRVIAVFDNDAASTAALTSLRTITLPQHIIVMQLPHLPLLRSYPTIGPTGPANMDINGMAASIELYLGSDALRSADGLPPIQWTGYESAVAKYQGELVGKADVQARFKRKLDLAREDQEALQNGDWSGLRAIMAALLRAFHSLDSALLSKQLRLFYERHGAYHL